MIFWGRDPIGSGDISWSDVMLANTGWGTLFQSVASAEADSLVLLPGLFCTITSTTSPLLSCTKYWPVTGFAVTLAC